MRTYAIGIDIGGTSAKIALVNARMRIAAKRSVPCDPAAPWERALSDIAAAARAVASGSNAVAVGIGCAGCIDSARGVVEFSPNLPRWRRVPLGRFMREALGVPCVVDNDVNMMAAGEQRHGAARGARNVFCLTIGTGVGGGIVIGGKLYRGGAMSAGEIGHVPVVPEGLRCPCGNRGCLERYVGKEGIIRLARSAMRRRRSALRGALTPALIAAAARRGDPAAGAAWEKAGYYLGIGLVGVVNLLNPDVIVIGGGIAGAGELLLAPARRQVRERALRVPARHVRIVRSLLGEDGGAVGAAGEALAALR